MYAVGIAQNHPEDANGPADSTLFWTLSEKKDIVDSFGRGEHEEVYLLEEHGGGEKLMGNEPDAEDGHFSIPLSSRIGRVTEGLVDKDGNLHTVIEFFHENPRSHEIMREIQGGAKYGVSVGLDYTKVRDGPVLTKKFAHLGLTKQPEFGDEHTRADPQDPSLAGTWLHVGAQSGHTIDHILAKQYLTQEGMYVSDRTRARIAKNLADPFKGVEYGSVGASRVTIDSPSSITLSSSLPAALPTALPTMDASLSMSLADLNPPPPGSAVPTPNPPAAASQQPPPPSSTPAPPPPSSNDVLRDDYMREVDELREQARGVVAANAAVTESSYRQAHELYRKMSAKFASRYFEDVPPDYAAAHADLGKHLFKTSTDLQHSLDQQKSLSPEDKKLHASIIRDPSTRLEHRPILQSIFASHESFQNFRIAEENLQRERKQREESESKQKDIEMKLENSLKRVRELEEKEKQTAEKRQRYDDSYGARFQSTNTAPSTPQAPAPAKEAPVIEKGSVGASRFVGSEIPVSQHRVRHDFSDVTLKLNEFKNSPFAKTDFDTDHAADLHSASRFAAQHQAQGMFAASGTFRV